MIEKSHTDGAIVRADDYRSKEVATHSGEQRSSTVPAPKASTATTDKFKFFAPMASEPFTLMVAKSKSFAPTATKFSAMIFFETKPPAEAALKLISMVHVPLKSTYNCVDTNRRAPSSFSKSKSALPHAFPATQTPALWAMHASPANVQVRKLIELDISG